MKRAIFTVFLVATSMACMSQNVDTLTDVRDGQKYVIVKIGDQVWMAENLRYMPHVSPCKEEGGIWVWGYQGNSVEEAKNTEKYKQVGCLYNWATAKSTDNNICPDGWHIPARDEILTLMVSAGLSKSKVDKAMKIKEIIAPKTVGVNLMPGGNSGFNYSFGGFKMHKANSSHFGKIGWYWTSTQAISPSAWILSMGSKVKETAATYWNQFSGLSVRCVKTDLP